MVRGLLLAQLQMDAVAVKNDRRDIRRALSCFLMGMGVMSDFRVVNISGNGTAIGGFAPVAGYLAINSDVYIVGMNDLPLCFRPRAELEVPSPDSVQV